MILFAEAIRTKLIKGMTCVLDNMCPHHFETEGEKLVVMPGMESIDRFIASMSCSLSLTAHSPRGLSPT